MKYRYFLPKRQVFVKDPATEVLPTPEPYANIESLYEAWEMLSEALAEADKRLKKILDTYGGEAQIPKEVKSAYDEYKKERAETKQAMQDLQKRGIYNPEAKKSIDEETQEISERTLTELDAAFAEYAKSEIGRPGDPTHSIVSPLFKDVPVPHASRKKKPGEKREDKPASAPESKEEKRAKSKESPEYWAALYRDIVKKIINRAVSGDGEDLTIEERTAAMFMKGGETKTIILDGMKYMLERDIPGKFLRLRNYWKDNGKNDDEMAKEDPYIASSGAQNRAPVWRTMTETDLEARKKKKEEEKKQKTEHDKAESLKALEGEIGKKIEWIFDADTPAGSKVSFWHIVSREQIEGTEQEKIVRMQVEMVRKYDGSVQTRFFEQHLIKDEKRFLNQPETKDETKTYAAANIEKCRNDIDRYLQSDSQILITEASPEEMEKERMAYVEKQLARAAENLTEASILPGQERLVRNDDSGLEEVKMVNPEFVRWLGEIQLIIDREKITEWEQNPLNGFIGHHVLVSGGKISILRENPEYEKYQERKSRTGETPKRVPLQYLAEYKDMRLPDDRLPREQTEERLAGGRKPKENKPA